jgi:hypothetical protein
VHAFGIWSEAARVDAAVTPQDIVCSSRIIRYSEQSSAAAALPDTPEQKKCDATTFLATAGVSQM